MSEMEKLIKRLDVMCDVVDTQLAKKGRLTNATACSFVQIATKIVAEYYDQKEKNDKRTNI